MNEEQTVKQTLTPEALEAIYNYVVSSRGVVGLSFEEEQLLGELYDILELKFPTEDFTELGDYKPFGESNFKGFTSDF